MEPKKAVEKTIKMWEWLAKNPDKDKESYLKQEYGEDEEEWPEQQYCYLCDIWYDKCFNHIKKVSLKCDCPLGVKACYFSSPYEDWIEASDDEEVTKRALRIVRACKRWLRKHEGE